MLSLLAHFSWIFLYYSSLFYLIFGIRACGLVKYYVTWTNTNKTHIKNIDKLLLIFFRFRIWCTLTPTTTKNRTKKKWTKLNQKIIDSLTLNLAIILVISLANLPHWLSDLISFKLNLPFLCFICVFVLFFPFLVYLSMCLCSCDSLEVNRSNHWKIRRSSVWAAQRIWHSGLAVRWHITHI